MRLHRAGASPLPDCKYPVLSQLRIKLQLGRRAVRKRDLPPLLLFGNRFLAESRPRMAPLAVRECQIPTERSFTIVTAQAVLPAARGKVFRGGRRSYLPALGQTGHQRVTGGTFQTLSCTMF